MRKRMIKRRQRFSQGVPSLVKTRSLTNRTDRDALAKIICCICKPKITKCCSMSAWLSDWLKRIDSSQCLACSPTWVFRVTNYLLKNFAESKSNNNLPWQSQHLSKIAQCRTLSTWTLSSKISGWISSSASSPNSFLKMLSNYSTRR